MNDETTNLDAAVDAVQKYKTAATERDDPPPRDTIRTALHHTHLPRLADAGILDYDPRQRTIRVTGRPSLEEWIDHARYKELD